MSQRNMIAANTSVFGALDEYCASRSEPLSNAGLPRWICTTSSGRRFLKDAVLVEELSLSALVKIARFEHSNRAFFVTSGFDIPDPPDILQVEEVDGGLLTAFLFEVKPSPAAFPSFIRNVVEVADLQSDPSYEGHDPLSICGMYPKIQVFSVEDLVQEQSFNTFLLLCLSDRRRIDQWIDAQLAETLNEIARLSPASIPYEILCRSVLDMDPGALFLALYRCLEALYSHTQTRRLMTVLEISKPWSEMAQTLEETLGWHPREEPSLEALLSHAVPEDLQGVASALRAEIPDSEKSATYVARKIYQLRNALVHYRPFHRKFPLEDINWNRMCEAMALLVFHIYCEINSAR
jgi:hypothetical protein